MHSLTLTSYQLRLVFLNDQWHRHDYQSNDLKHPLDVWPPSFLWSLHDGVDVSSMS